MKILPPEVSLTNIIRTTPTNINLKNLIIMLFHKQLNTLMTFTINQKIDLRVFNIDTRQFIDYSANLMYGSFRLLAKTFYFYIFSITGD